MAASSQQPGETFGGREGLSLQELRLTRPHEATTLLLEAKAEDEHFKAALLSRALPLCPP